LSSFIVFPLLLIIITPLPTAHCPLFPPHFPRTLLYFTLTPRCLHGHSLLPRQSSERVQNQCPDDPWEAHCADARKSAAATPAESAASRVCGGILCRPLLSGQARLFVLYSPVAVPGVGGEKSAFNLLRKGGTTMVLL
jgi:hypothetical protein